MNILLVYFWPKITDYRINKGKFYPDKVLELIDIQPKERANFFREMLIDRKFEYHKYIVHYEQNTKNQKSENYAINYVQNISTIQFHKHTNDQGQ